jgi:hypothetical protein
LEKYLKVVFPDISWKSLAIGVKNRRTNRIELDIEVEFWDSNNLVFQKNHFNCNVF